jgi:tetrahydromethanopterin S-methyltransferase subunit G
MSTESDNLVLEHLRHIRARVDGLADDMKIVVSRLGVIEGHVANFHVSEAVQNVELDRIKLRLDRVERRLDLVD